MSHQAADALFKVFGMKAVKPMSFLDYLSDDERHRFNQFSTALEDEEQTVDDLEDELQQARDRKAKMDRKLRDLITLAGERESKAKAEIEASLADLCEKPQ